MRPFRNALLIFVISACCSSGHAATPGYNKDNAPDAISREILRKPLKRVYEGAPAGVDPSPTIHRNFPQVIEQNFARLDARGMAALIDALSDGELSDLAQLYVNATTDHGLPPKLLYVMAYQLDARRLGRISSHFGFAPIYEAVNAVAFEKTQEFIKLSSTGYAAPVPGEMRFGPAGRFAPQVRTLSVQAWHPSHIMRPQFTNTIFSTSSNAFSPLPHRLLTAGFGQFVDMTPYEIYLDFRTAPVGALGVTGALWESSVVMSSTLLPAYGVGYAIGTQVVGPLIQTYAPSLWDAIGGTIGTIIDSLSDSWSGGGSTAGAAQKSTAPTFQSTSQQINDFGAFGGDYGAADDWSDYYGGGGCGGNCPPIDER